MNTTNLIEPRRGTFASAVGRLAWIGGLVGIIVTANGQDGKLDIQRAVLLTWPQSPLHVVLEATAAEGPWTICPRPIHRAPDILQLSVPCADSNKLFKLCPGIQLIEDFSDGNLDQCWKGYEGQGETGFTYVVTNGMLRVRAATTGESAFQIVPQCAWIPDDTWFPDNSPGANEFVTSVDILSWSEAKGQMV